MIRDLWTRLSNNPDYLWSIVSSYGHMGLNIILQIALVPFYLRHMEKTEFGILMIVLAGINYLGMGVAWISSGGQRILGEQYAQNETAELTRTYGLMKLLFCGYALVAAVGVLLSVWLLQGVFFGDDSVLRDATLTMLMIGGIYLVLLYDINVDRLVLIATGHQFQANLLNILSLVVFAGAVFPVILNGWGLIGVMGALLGGVIVARLVAYMVLLRYRLHIRLPRLGAGSPERDVLKRLMGPMGLGYAAYGVFLLTLLQADTLILGMIGSAALVADFILVWKIADVAMQLLWRLPETLVPYLIQMDAKGEGERMHNLFSLGQKTMVALAALAALLYALFGQNIVELWVGAENTPDLPWAYALAGGAIFWMVIARLPAVYAFSRVQLKPLVMVTGLETVGKVILLFALFPVLGLYAPMAAINIVHILGIAWLYQRLNRPETT